MNKQERFIMAVQTGVIIRGILKPWPNPTNTVNYALNNLEDAMNAAPHIPETMSANEAAQEFLAYIYDIPEREKDNDSWFMRNPRNRGQHPDSPS